MQAFNFMAKPENGLIRIPDHYREMISGDVMVIVINNDSGHATHGKGLTPDKMKGLSPPSLMTKGWKFDREEANAR